MTILELLETHYKAEWNERGRRQCDCGHEFTERYSAEIHRAHAAEELDRYVQERCYEAWSAGWHDSHYQHTANNERRGQGHPEVAYSNPYRAAQLKDQP